MGTGKDNRSDQKGRRFKMNISLSNNDWTKLRQLIQRIFMTKYLAPDIKKGVSQLDAGAVKGELWADTSDNNRIKLGI
jgi:hypothetical protein